MKNLNYNKEDCTLCKGAKVIKVAPNDLALSLVGEFVKCPLCDGKGHLNILKVEEHK